MDALVVAQGMGGPAGRLFCHLTLPVLGFGSNERSQEEVSWPDWLTRCFSTM